MIKKLSHKSAGNAVEMRKIQLLNDIKALHLELKILSDQRDLYLAKLRSIEILCEKSCAHGPNPLAERILGILHATKDGFQAPDEIPYY